MSGQNKTKKTVSINFHLLPQVLINSGKSCGLTPNKLHALNNLKNTNHLSARKRKI